MKKIHNMVTDKYHDIVSGTNGFGEGCEFQGSLYKAAITRDGDTFPLRVDGADVRSTSNKLVKSMNMRSAIGVGMGCLMASAGNLRGEVNVAIEHHEGIEILSGFSFKKAGAPLRNDAASTAVFAIVDGEPDANSGRANVLNDGLVPDQDDQPPANFFFKTGSDGGRLRVDLGAVINISQVNTWSWHSDARAPQVYRVYASDGTMSGFNAGPKQGVDPAACGWRLVANVDSRPKKGETGGQYVVSISDAAGSIGKYRYLLFCFACTDAKDPNSNTFYSEIDVVDADAPPPENGKPSAVKRACELFEAGEGKYRIFIDTTETPDLTQWAHDKLAPVLVEWYPKIVRLLPGKDYEAPEKIRIHFTRGLIGRFVAATDGARIYCAGNWFRQTLAGEAVGSVVHEMVHVVQQYRQIMKRNRNGAPAPAWLTEGIADYVRWYLYEPQSPGGEIAKTDIAKVRYDNQYRVSANFLNWVSKKYDKDAVEKVNAAVRDGIYSDELWQKFTGHSVQELDAEWKEWLHNMVTDK